MEEGWFGALGEPVAEELCLVIGDDGRFPLLGGGREDLNRLGADGFSAFEDFVDTAGGGDVGADVHGPIVPGTQSPVLRGWGTGSREGGTGLYRMRLQLGVVSRMLGRDHWVPGTGYWVLNTEVSCDN